MSTEHTESVITWTLSRPVLTAWLAEIAHDNIEDELMCTVVDLLDPRRDGYAAAFLHAVGAPSDDADAVHHVLSRGIGGHWLGQVDWPRVQRELLHRWRQHDASF